MPVTTRDLGLSSLEFRLSELEREECLTLRSRKEGTLRTVQPATEARLSASGAGQKGKNGNSAKPNPYCVRSRRWVVPKGS